MHENAIKKNVWQSGKVVTHKECVFTKSAFRCTMTTTEGTRGRGTDRHEEKVIKPGFRQPFMCSQTQTPFEVMRRFWAYISHNSGWIKNEMIKVD